jgi:5-hydroxyisourate hydrolase
MSLITTHVLDTSAGRPIAGLLVTLEHRDASGQWLAIAEGRTDAAGRIPDLLPGDHALETGLYRLRFDTSARSAFFPEVVLCFRVDDPSQHFHLPLLFSPFGYTTYRGS